MCYLSYFLSATATGAPAYQPTQTGYAVAPTAAAAATYTTQRAAPAYDTAYPTAATHTTPGTYAGIGSSLFTLIVTLLFLSYF
jgi:hypothetical protein